MRKWLLVLVVLAACDEDKPSGTGLPTGPATTAASTSSAGGAAGAGGMTSAGGAVGGNGEGGMTPLDPCTACLGPVVAPQGPCASQLQACNGDAGCTSWLRCYEKCLGQDFTATCFDACDTMFAASAAVYGPLSTCFCSSCATECAPFCS